MNIHLHFNETTKNKWLQNKKLTLNKQLLLILSGSLLLAICANIAVPFYPVPMTLQTMGVLFIAMLYGWRLGTLTVLAYLFEGTIGLPFFANGAFGLATLLGPHVGYLIGFVFSAMVSGFLVEHGWGKHYWGVFAAGIAGEIALYAIAVPVLATFIGWHHALILGLLPFILGDIIKLIGVAAALPYFRR